MSSVHITRIVGWVVFVLGIVLLIVVFIQARADLERPLTGVPATMGIDLARRVGLLFIMGYVASSLAGRGCQMYQAAALDSSSTEKRP